MRRVLRVAAVLFAAAGAAAAAQDSAPDATAPTTAPATPASRPRIRTRQPIHDSAERQIEAVFRAHVNPCELARTRGVACFPVSIEREGPRFSVKDAIRTYRPDGRPAPGVPTSSEIQKQLSGAPRSASGGVSTDPTCAVKSLARLFRGSPNTFFLYRTWNAKGGEEPLLTDHKLDPNPYASTAVRFEFLGEFKGECDAIAAWRRSLRQAMAPPALEDDSHGVEAKPAGEASPGEPPP